MNVVLATLLTAGLMHGAPGIVPASQEQTTEIQYLMAEANYAAGVDSNVSTGFSLASAEFRSMTGLAATVAQLRQYVSAMGTPSARFDQQIGVWCRAWYPKATEHQGLVDLERALDVPMGPPTTALAVTAIHLWGIRQAYLHHWAYAAEPGDTLTDLAIATGRSLASVTRDNPEHAPILWVGQLVSWTTPPASKTPNISVGSAPLPPPLPTSGVLAQLRPVAGLVIEDPNVSALSNLLRAEPVGQSLTIAVLGQWALFHGRILARASREGNTIAIEGYSTTALGSLPAWGISQELSWSQKIVHQAIGSTPSYVLLAPRVATPAVLTVSERLGLRFVPISATVEEAGAKGWVTTVSQILLSHPDRLTVAPPVTSYRLWRQLFSKLAKDRLTLATLTQIWSIQ